MRHNVREVTVIVTKIEAFGYRCLREVRQELGLYQILVGPNGSGKSVFLDVIAFLGDLVSGGLQKAVIARTENFYDLVWGRKDGSFHLAVEAATSQQEPILIRYEIEAKLEANDDQITISRERLTVTEASGQLLPLITREGQLVSLAPEMGAGASLTLNPSYSALTTLFTQKTEFPSVAHLTNLLWDGAKTVALDNKLLRAPSRPGGGRAAIHDGSRLARMVAQIQDSSNEVLRSWVRHVQTAIPDVAAIRTIPRPEERSLYLMVQYAGGVEVPQWMLSDGTLRLLALTILAYLPDFHGVYLIEEPEVGVHPTAIETIMQSLSSVYEGQVLVTSHSPIVLGLARPDQLLCFQKNENGTTIIPGSEHPMLREWKSGVNVSDLFAAGVLG